MLRVNIFILIAIDSNLSIYIYIYIYILSAYKDISVSCTNHVHVEKDIFLYIYSLKMFQCWHKFEKISFLKNNCFFFFLNYFCRKNSLCISLHFCGDEVFSFFGLFCTDYFLRRTTCTYTWVIWSNCQGMLILWWWKTYWRKRNLQGIDIRIHKYHLYKIILFKIQIVFFFFLLLSIRSKLWEKYTRE